MNIYLKLILIIIGVSLTSCFKVHKKTDSICDCKLYVEVYEINPAGIDGNYLTDSLNFRVYIGKYDPDFALFQFNCRGDSIYVDRLNNRNSYLSDTVMIVKERKVLSLQLLKKQHKFE